jgi:alkanesulfonate monooxygenase SsuD/methylene tetrahydromethanopterin reductase-like flavin-dependent oxidoreductase (luciferase family)
MGSSLKILAVDDEPSIVQSMFFIFEQPMYELDSAGDGEAALARVAANPNPFDVVITDNNMPKDTIERAAKRGAGELEGVSYDMLDEMDAVIVGDPQRCIEKARKYFGAGCDQILCLMQPHSIPRDAVMRSIELFGEHVIPKFR